MKLTDASKIDAISFMPCTGFGNAGRLASLYADSMPIGAGAGETDEEAVLEALVDGGMTFDAAFDAVYTVLQQATITRD